MRFSVSSETRKRVRPFNTVRINAPQITWAQQRFLAQTVDDVDLSTRATNCLKNANLRYLGELIQWGPEELLTIPNLGKKSVDEIVALFAKENLTLGVTLANGAAELSESSTFVAIEQPSPIHLTGAQCAFLAQTLNEVDLSVRTSNCLIALNIKYLGELIQLRPEELLKIWHFGKKSLREIEDLFTTVNLPLGLQIPNWTPDFRVSESAESVPGTGEKAVVVKDPFSSGQKAFLAQKLLRFRLSKRVSEFLAEAEIFRIGDLATLPMDRVSKIVVADRRVLRELVGLLVSEDLYFGLEIPDWSSDLALAWEQTYSTELQHIELHHHMEGSGSPPFYLEDELVELVQTILYKSGDRNRKIVVQFFGFDGSGRKTLQEVGIKFGITRERVRQITAGFERRLHGKSIYLPMFRSAGNLILERIPASTGAVGEELRKRQITRTKFDVSGITALLRLIEEDELFAIATIAGETFAVKRDAVDTLGRVPRIARGLVSTYGCGHIEHIISYSQEEFELELTSHEVKVALEGIPGIKWLDDERQWFTILDTKRNRLNNVVRKVVSVAQRLTVAELRAAIKRVHRLDGFAPPSEILRAFCRTLPDSEINGDYIINVGRLNPDHTLGEIEHCFYDVLRDHRSVMTMSALRDECLSRGLNANSFYQYLTYSPIVCRLAREVYCLVGAEIPPGTIEGISKITPRGPVLIGHSWTEDGRVWISYRLNTANLRSGQFTLPASLKGIIRGEYFVQSSGTGTQSKILAEGDRLIGLHRPIVIRGGEVNDTIVVTFDLRLLKAELRFDDRPNDNDEDAISATRYTVTAVNANPAVELENEEIREKGVAVEWQPIATAPMDQDLKVRLQDALGRYELLFPCRNVPGQGWINTWLKKPLREDPVDWRVWDEPLT